MHPSVRLAAPGELTAAGEVLVAAYQFGGFLDDAHSPYAATLADTPRRSREAEFYASVIDGTVVGT